MTVIIKFTVINKVNETDIVNVIGVMIIGILLYRQNSWNMMIWMKEILILTIQLVNFFLKNLIFIIYGAALRVKFLFLIFFRDHLMIHHFMSTKFK